MNDFFNLNNCRNFCNKGCGRRCPRCGGYYNFQQNDVRVPLVVTGPVGPRGPQGIQGPTGPAA